MASLTSAANASENVSAVRQSGKQKRQELKEDEKAVDWFQSVLRSFHDFGP
jgi:hypothetical protein